MRIEQIYTSCLAEAAYYVSSNGEAEEFKKAAVPNSIFIGIDSSFAGLKENNNLKISAYQEQKTLL